MSTNQTTSRRKAILAFGSLGIVLLGATIAGAKTPADTQESPLSKIQRRSIDIDLGEGLKTNAELTFPASGRAPYPALMLIHGGGAFDKDMFLPPDSRPFLTIASYFSERGFAVLRYDKRGIGSNDIVLDKNVWGNATLTSLTADAGMALEVLKQQPEVDKDRITIFGGSWGAWTAIRLAAADPSIKNIVLASSGATKWSEASHRYNVEVPLRYANERIDTNNDGLLTVSELIKATAGTALWYQGPLPTSILVENTTGQFHWKPYLGVEEGGELSISKALAPFLEKRFASLFVDSPTGECIDPFLCPIVLRSFAPSDSLSFIGNVSASTGVLFVHGDGDLGQPTDQPRMLLEKLDSVGHPDRKLNVYAGLGHLLTPVQEEWIDVAPGEIPSYVFEDIYAWLTEPHRNSTSE